MQFLYTGASAFNSAQDDAYNSLGGYVSSSPVPNNALNNIFGDFSWQSVQKKRVETRGLVLKNVLGFDCTDVVFGYIYPTPAGATFKLEVAFVALTGSGTTMERIPNGEGTPLYATFTEASIISPSPDNSVDIGALANNASIGLWLRLTVLAGLTPPSFPDVPTELAWWKNISDPNYNVLQNIQIKLKYTYVQ